MWYETCIFWEAGSWVIDRYSTESVAQTMHEEIVEMIENGNYTIPEPGYGQIELQR